MAPNAGIQIYIGLLVMAVAPLIYSQMNPYVSRNDHQLMIFTQLAQTVVVLCGMVRENVKGNMANWVVTAIIMGTLCPMFLVLALFVWDPRSVHMPMCSYQSSLLSACVFLAAAEQHIVCSHQRNLKRNGIS
jgi:hypothetical protein